MSSPSCVLNLVHTVADAIDDFPLEKPRLAAEAGVFGFELPTLRTISALTLSY